MKKIVLLSIFAMLLVIQITDIGLVGAIDPDLCSDDGVMEEPDWVLDSGPGAGRDGNQCLNINPGNGDPVIPFQYENLHKLGVSIACDGTPPAGVDEIDHKADAWGECSTKESGEFCTILFYNTTFDNYLDPGCKNKDILFYGGGNGIQYWYFKDSKIINGWKCSGGAWNGPNGISCAACIDLPCPNTDPRGCSCAHADGVQFRGGQLSAGGWMIWQDSYLANAGNALSRFTDPPNYGPSGSMLFQGLRTGIWSEPLGASQNWKQECRDRETNDQYCTTNKNIISYGGNAGIQELWFIDVSGGGNGGTLFQLKNKIGKLVIVNTGCGSNGCDGTIEYVNGWPWPIDSDGGPGVCPNGLIKENPIGSGYSSGGTYCYTSIEEARDDTFTSSSNQGDCPDCPHKLPPFIHLSDTGWENPPSGIMCGDGIVEGTEECDDNNTVSGDGCSADCRIECSDNDDCDDGIFCNGLETCGGDNLCQSGEPPCPEDSYSCTTISCDEGGTCPISYNDLACDDSNTCTTDTCNVTGCEYTNVPDTTACDDSTVCTTNDACLSGLCSGDAITACTNDDGCCPTDCNETNDNDCDSSLTLDLKFDGDMQDSSGNNNHGTCTNCPVPATGKVGDAYSFDGDNDYIDAGSDSTLDDLPAFTYTAWIYPTSDGDREILSKSGSDRELRLAGTGSGIYLRGCVVLSSGNACSNSDPGFVALDEWNFVSMTFDDGGDRETHLYVDGSEVGYDSQGHGSGTLSSDASSDLNIGRRTSGNRYFQGVIDEVRVYDRALSEQEISDIMAGPSTHHRADTNKNGCIDGGEIKGFIEMWYEDVTLVSMVELVRALEIWKTPCQAT
jgi:cysteine-rich repeat protein